MPNHMLEKEIFNELNIFKVDHTSIPFMNQLGQSTELNINDLGFFPLLSCRVDKYINQNIEVL